MKNAIQTLLVVSAGIILTGLLLEQAGKGRFGAGVKGIAQNVTRGYGV